MSTPPYIDSTGFHALGLNGWVSNLTSMWQSIYGTDKDFSSSTPDGQLIAGIAARFNNLEQLAQQIYTGRSPAGAVGAGLSRLVGLNGISRKPAQASSATVVISGTPGTVIPSGSLVGSSTDSTKPAFATVSNLTIGGGGSISGTVQCTAMGPIPVAAAELTVILSPVSGWTTVTNVAAGTPGMNVEADPALRVRRAGSVALPSQSMLDGLQGALQALHVTDARVYENTGGVPDSKGLPPHSIQCIIQNASETNSNIANVIWLKTGMGVTKVGGQSAPVTDANGDTQTMYWDWASALNVYIVIKLDRAAPSLTGVNSPIPAAIVNYFAQSGPMPALIGQNVAWADLFSPINALGLTGRPGLPSITAIYIGTSPSPTSQADLVVPYNAIASFDVSRISVQYP